MKGVVSKKTWSVVNGIKFDFPLSNTKNYLHQNGIKGFERFKFLLKYKIEKRKAFKKGRIALQTKKVFIGPFYGEFGNFLGHVLPMISYFHKRGVAIYFCGPSIFDSFLFDDKGNRMVKEFTALRDFYAEVKPSANNVVLPQDIKKEVDSFVDKALKEQTFFNLQDGFYYWFVHRELTAEHFSEMYDLSNVYKNKNDSKRSVALFPRKKGPEFTPNNGGAWDYQEIIENLKSKFDLIYVVGHPSYVTNIEKQEKVELVITNDNKRIIEVCSNSEVIISQHSGVIYLAPLLQKPFILIFNGVNSPSKIKSLNNTLYFMNSFKVPYEIDYCFSLEDIDGKTEFK